MFSSNKSQFLSGLKKEPDKLKRKYLVLIRKAIIFAHQGVTSRTPVHTGTALANYIWSIGVPSPAFTGTISGGPTGNTNTMPLGSEPRRGAAQAIADRSRDTVLNSTDPYQNFILSNNTPHIKGLEYGRFPKPPLRQRSPNGMFRITIAALAARLRAGAI